MGFATLKYIPLSPSGGATASNLAFVPGVSSGLISNSNGTGATIALATTTNAGFMSGAQVTQLSNTQPFLVSSTNIKTVNGTTLLGSGDLVIPGSVSNLSVGAATATTQPIANTNGTGFVLPIASSTTAGLLSSAQQVQLGLLPVSGIQAINSVTGAGTVASPLKLVGDVASPTASQYYGTNATSVKAFYNLPNAGLLDKYNAGVGVFVQADAATITATKINGVFTINIPSGVHCTFIDVNVLGADIQATADGSGATNWINIIINSNSVGGTPGLYKFPCVTGMFCPVGAINVNANVVYNVTNQSFINCNVNTITFRKTNMVSANDYVLTFTGV